MSDKILYAWVPGLPHLLRPDLSEQYSQLASACEMIGEEFAKNNVKRILYYSTQWLSVLGQSVQLKSRLSGLHVDENWYDLASLRFDFHIDQELANALIEGTAAEGFQVRSVDYDGFPVDTGSIVANQLMNKTNIKTGMHSCCVYSNYQETVRLGSIARKAAEKLDGKTAMVAVSGLSGRFFTTDIDYREDHVRNPIDDQWNKKMLALMAAGDWLAVSELREQYAAEAKVDMGFKALAFLEGAGACESGKRLNTLAYGAIYGTGAGVMMGN